MKESMGQNTGNAQIIRVGHTASTKHGSNPDMKGPGQGTPRDLTLGINTPKG